MASGNLPPFFRSEIAHGYSTALKIGKSYSESSESTTQISPTLKSGNKFAIFRVVNFFSHA
ncbi:unknown protein [Simkania negevensis Z]|uniref:Uncharacterized protein n=1 Tax=Simkania negevensis (strain ATCC VR-1471 / DSM 27360 / Z) TaxID=331113 RepID=F8L3K1_SIMNZ|nr:unknown protein [Simkania negevensis Z]